LDEVTPLQFPFSVCFVTSIFTSLGFIFLDCLRQLDEGEKNQLFILIYRALS